MEFASRIVLDQFLVNVKRLYSLNSVDKALRDMNAILWELDLLRLGADDHMNRNKRSHLEVPDQVTWWLQDVEQIRARVRNLPNNDSGTCFRFFTMPMPRLVKKVLKIIQVIESLKTQYSLITWTDYPIPLGRVDTMNASMRTTCIPSTRLNDFPSREQIFLEALKELEQNRQSHMVALWGMSGVGKTKMMQNLKKALKEKKMFGFIIEAVVGENTDPIAIQEAVADYLGIDLKESTKLARADKLRRWFEANSNEGKNDILVILDDVWQPIDMNDIGLSPLPDQGIAFKVLLTSRDRDVCARMGVEANSILHVRPLIDVEAQGLFRQFVEVSGNVDPELQKIGEDIVRKCCGLPIAIKSLAGTLKNKGKATWSDALTRLERHNYYNDLPELFESSYANLRDEETKSIFLLCGLFPEDFNIPTEDLVRFGWGLKLFKRGSTIREARNRLDTCIEQLMHTNLLIRSDDVGCVKMHGLVLAFVLDMFSKAEHASFVRHDSMPGWPANDTSISTKRISLTCKGMSQFPGDLKFPNLTILKLMSGNESLRFPKGFYGEMKNLHVIAYEKMKCLFLPSSLQCSTNLRVLYLHQCSLMSDCSSIGELSNLEVLSFAHSGIQWLPSTLGNLKKLRLLDLTNCFDLRIDKGVLKKLGKLEELYMRVNDQARVDGRNAISFTDDNCNELAERSKYLSALEFEFFQNNARPENMSFTNIERFKISVGCSLKGTFTKSMHSFENTLKLVTNKGELLESRMNELFQITKVLCLSVDYMKDLEDVEVNSSLSQQSSSFSNLRVLVFSECTELRYLFTLRIAKALSNLEHLEVYACDNITELINTESGGEETVTFPKLKFLSLILLPNLLGLCRKGNIIELPQLVELRLGAIPNFTSIFPKNNPLASSFLKKEVVSPKLEKLHIRHMENLKEIWPLEVRESDEVNVSLLREIEVTDCDNLVNFFPCNPMPLLHHLKDLEVRNCGSIEVLFNIDLDCFGEIKEEVVCSSSLRSIKVYNLGKLRELWSIKSAVNSGLLIRGFQAVEYIEITKCKSFRNVFVPTTINFDLGALMEIWINNKGKIGRKNEQAESSQEQQIIVISNEETSEVSDCISNVVFPSYLIHAFRNLKKLKLWNSERPEVVFEIESPQSRELVPSEDNQRLLPYLEELDIRHMDNITQVWKCNWNKLSVFHNHQSESPFHNLTTMHVSECRSMKYLFSPLMAKLLSNLKHVKIAICDDIEEVISNRNDEDEGENEIERNNATSIHTSTTLFPHLAFLNLYYLRNLKHIGGGGTKSRSSELSFGNTATSTASHQSTFSRVDDVSWSLCQYSKEIRIVECHALLSVIPYHAAGHMHQLQVLKIESCNSMQEVFETHNGPRSNTNIDEGNGDTSTIPRPNNVITLNLANLKILEIKDCGLLEYVFTFSSLQSLWNLEELMIENCRAMKVIVKEEHGEQTSSMVVVFGRLRSISLVNLPNLVDFFSGVNEFRWPLLDKVTVYDCTQMVAFNPGRSVAQIYRSTPGQRQTSRQPVRRRSS